MGWSRLVYPFDMLLEAQGQAMRLCLSDTVIELKDFHCLSALQLALDTMFIECKLAVIDIKLRLQKDVQELGLQAWRTPQDELGGLLSREDMWMLVTVWNLLLHHLSTASTCGLLWI